MRGVRPCHAAARIRVAGGLSHNGDIGTALALSVARPLSGSASQAGRNYGMKLPQIRAKAFAVPLIGFVLVCAAVTTPVLAQEAEVAQNLGAVSGAGMLLYKLQRLIGGGYINAR